MEERNIKQEIMKELMDMGFSFKYIGTVYMVEAIEMIYFSEDINLRRSIEKNVYSKLSEIHNKKISTIKSNIIKATNFVDDQIYIRRRVRKDEYSKVYDKMTPKAIINSILTKLGA